MHSRAAEFIRALNLQPHPEGGYFREIFRSPHRVQPPDDRDERSALTTIYFLLTDKSYSRFHRVRSDEVWHFYEGSILQLIWIEPDMKQYHHCLLGPVSDESKPVQIVPAGCWQAARTTSAYSLVGCTVGPGFEFKDFAMISDFREEAETIQERFPELKMFLK